MEFIKDLIPISGVSFFLFCVFAILFAGYAFGRITIKGVSLGDAGVFIMALLFGALFCSDLMPSTFGVKAISFDESWLNLIESFGLILFVTSVGFIAGPKFFANMKKNFKSYVLLGLVIIIAGGLAAFGCIMLGKYVFGWGASTITDIDGFVAMIVGLLSGSLTSTPAFSAAKATVAPELQSLVSVGHGIAYIFGVIGVVLFVQLVPKIMKADMDVERSKISVSSQNSEGKVKKVVKLLHLDHMGVAAFSVAAILGTVVGKI
jgi:putative transport protein